MGTSGCAPFLGRRIVFSFQKLCPHKTEPKNKVPTGVCGYTLTHA